MDDRTVVIVDDTTIYEIDMDCYECLTKEEKEKWFSGNAYRKNDNNRTKEDN